MSDAMTKATKKVQPKITTVDQAAAAYGSTLNRCANAPV
jgi:hypothetical protein